MHHICFCQAHPKHRSFRYAHRLLVAITLSVFGFNSISQAELIVLDNIVLDGFQPVPPTGSLATGSARVEIDTVTRFINIEGEFSGLEGEVLFGHLHGPAGFGESNPLIFVFLEIGGDFGTSGTFTANQRLSTFQLNAVLDSRTYLNIHSVPYPSGEIRGQVVVPTSSTLAALGFGGLFVTRRRRA